MAKEVRSIRVEPALWRRARAHARKEGVTVTDVVVRSLEAALAPLKVEAARAVLTEAERKAAHLGLPPTKSRSRWAI